MHVIVFTHFILNSSCSVLTLNGLDLQNQVFKATNVGDND